MRLSQRLMKLEVKHQEANSMCHDIDWFYGMESQPVPLMPNQSLSNFYNSQNSKEANHANAKPKTG